MHFQIVGNLVGAPVNATVDSPCIVLTSSMKVYAPVSDSDAHPDVSLVCGQPEFVGDGIDVIANPTVILEVLFDRSEKFRGYCAVPSVIDEIHRKVSSLDQLPVGVSTRSSYVLDECHQFALPR